MKQKALKITVSQNDVIVYEREVANPQEVMAVFALFDTVGTKVECEIYNHEVSLPNSPK